MIQPYLTMLRPVHWLKNLLVFLPMLFAQAYAGSYWLATLQAFVIFCLAASAVYIANDVADQAHDRLSESKKHRPVAAGVIQTRAAIAISVTLSVIALSLSLMIFGTDFFFIILLYFSLNVLYFLFLKKITYLDLALLGVFYLLRLEAGSTAIAVDLSWWLFSFILILFIALSSIKRLAEIAVMTQKGATVVPGRSYQARDIMPLKVIAMLGGILSVGILLAYALSDKAHSLYAWPFLFILNALILSFWFARIFRQASLGHVINDPVDYTIRDIPSLICVALVSIITLVAMAMPLQG